MMQPVRTQMTYLSAALVLVVQLCHQSIDSLLQHLSPALFHSHFVLRLVPQTLCERLLVGLQLRTKLVQRCLVVVQVLFLRCTVLQRVL